MRTWTAVLPFSLLSTDTTESAGWDTTAQNTPAATHKKHTLIQMRYKCSTELKPVRQLWSASPLVLTNVAGHEGDHQLLGLGALAAGLGDNILVEQLHGALKAGKLHHGVGDLPHPQRNHTLVEAAGVGDIVKAEMMSRRI